MGVEGVCEERGDDIENGERNNANNLIVLFENVRRRKCLCLDCLESFVFHKLSFTGLGAISCHWGFLGFR